MKFSINSKALLSILTPAGKVINKRPAISILSNFLFELELAENCLTITAGDTESVVKAHINVEGLDSDARFCVDSARITELLKAMPDCPVQFDYDSKTQQVELRYANAKYNIPAVSADEYPLGDKTQPTDIIGQFNMPVTEILTMFDRVSFAISDDSIRPVMCGIFWDIKKDDAIVFVATDSHSLVKYRNTQTVPDFDLGFILPGASLPLIRAFIGKQAQVDVQLTDKAIFINGETFSLRIPKILGNFPNYNRVIPSELPFKAIVDRNDFINAISRVSICADSTNSLMRLSFSPGALKISAQDFSYNTAGEETLKCDFNGDKTFEIGFSSVYLKEVVNAIPTQNVIIKLSDPSRPGLFFPSENDEFGEQTILLMPIQLMAE